jgi:1-deoxy-D-xylulose-5-phosphate reductoisomerase
MKIKINILGSTGSIGSTTLKIIEKKKKYFVVNTLVANSNTKEIYKQIIKFRPKNFIITNKKTYEKIIKKKFQKTNIFYKYNKYNFKKKTDITIAAIPGISGLEPTINFIKSTKKILLANKESIICGWSIIKKLAKKNRTEIIPLDSEHFSIKELTTNYSDSEIDKIYITASGGPFLNLKLNNFKNIKIKDALKHPRWNMGKKISIDSATLMNKILELLEAQKLFHFKKHKYKIIIHPQSLIHAIVKFNNGTSKFLFHETDMTIPISNAIFNSKVEIADFINQRKKENLIFPNLTFEKVNKNKFPIIKILPKLNKYPSTPIIINAANEILVDQFLSGKISFNSIIDNLFWVLKDKYYKKYAIKTPSSLKIIYLIDKWSRKKTLEIILKKKM